MRNRDSLIVGMAIGAGLMYLLDPDRGRRRRALVRDQVIHARTEVEHLGEEVESRARHMRNRVRGLAHEATTPKREEVDDTVLEARVRSALGRLVANPGEVDVSAEHGRVTLRGTASEDEVHALVDGVQSIPGVHDVISRLRSGESA